ncbi:protein FLOURY 1-like [Lolium rigidum]|uniref:protein FLOURY 1-like n=1 Tax=Lolium rigidum TaxID=89674 RepID=UPI001F5CC0C5|nr:protein FLOURY 1-like [Lolium rigidum]
MGGWNRISGARFLKPLAGVSLAFLPSAGAAYFLVGSAIGFLAMLHASEPDVGGQWASAARWIALSRSVSAHHLFLAMLLLSLAAKVWRLGKRCDAVEGIVGNAGGTAQALRLRGVVCTVCGTTARAPKKGSLGPTLERVESSGCSNKPVSRSLASELELEAAETEDEDNGSEATGAEEGNVEWLRRRLARERRLKEAALEELEKERRAAASAADEAMAKIACLRNEKALVEREARQFREMAQQKQMYDRQVIESLQWMINKFGMQSGEPEYSFDRGVAETSEDDRDKR